MLAGFLRKLRMKYICPHLNGSSLKRQMSRAGGICSFWGMRMLHFVHPNVKVVANVRGVQAVCFRFSLYYWYARSYMPHMI